MEKIAVLTGAGISAESGISTFRDSDGLWENHRVEDVATYSAWERNPELILKFYNERKRQLDTVEPNAAHKALVELEKKYQVTIITQNVDDLHERAGSSNIIHLHGELRKKRSSIDDNLVYDWGDEDLKMGDKCELGSQMRPHIVWFGEMVPMLGAATEVVSRADYIIVIGTSMVVYPAASLIHYAKVNSQKYYIDPKASNVNGVKNMVSIAEKAGKGVPQLVSELMSK